MRFKRYIPLAILLLTASFAYAQSDNDSQQVNTPDINEQISPEETELPRAAISFMNSKVSFTEGVSYAQVTRIEVQENASNFVRENMMAGAFFTAQTNDLSFFDLTLTVSAYYPFYQAFNGMAQKTKNMFNYAVDGFFGATITYDGFKYILLTGSVGMHYMFQLTDEYYMHYVGIGGMLGMELPVSKHFTLVESNYFSYDNANLGSNKKVQPFDGAYQYHINLGIRYSKAVENRYSYIR